MTFRKADGFEDIDVRWDGECVVVRYASLNTGLHSVVLTPEGAAKLLTQLQSLLGANDGGP